MRLVGRKEFYSLGLAVSPAVLIPRPDSEFVVVEFMAVAKGLEAPRAVDVGTGSGCLALACAHQHKTARFVATDISPEALKLAEANARTHGLGDRVEFRLGDRLGPVAIAFVPMILSTLMFLPALWYEGRKLGRPWASPTAPGGSGITPARSSWYLLVIFAIVARLPCTASTRQGRSLAPGPSS